MAAFGQSLVGVSRSTPSAASRSLPSTSENRSTWYSESTSSPPLLSPRYSESSVIRRPEPGSAERTALVAAGRVRVAGSTSMPKRPTTARQGEAIAAATRRASPPPARPKRTPKRPSSLGRLPPPDPVAHLSKPGRNRAAALVPPYLPPSSLCLCTLRLPRSASLTQARLDARPPTPLRPGVPDRRVRRLGPSVPAGTQLGRGAAQAPSGARQRGAKRGSESRGGTAAPSARGQRFQASRGPVALRLGGSVAGAAARRGAGPGIMWRRRRKGGEIGALDKSDHGGPEPP